MYFLWDGSAHAATTVLEWTGGVGTPARVTVCVPAGDRSTQTAAGRDRSSVTAAGEDRSTRTVAATVPEC